MQVITMYKSRMRLVDWPISVAMRLAPLTMVRCNGAGIFVCTYGSDSTKPVSLKADLKQNCISSS